MRLQNQKTMWINYQENEQKSYGFLSEYYSHTESSLELKKHRYYNRLKILEIKTNKALKYLKSITVFQINN